MRNKILVSFIQKKTFYKIVMSILIGGTVCKTNNLIS